MAFPLTTEDYMSFLTELERRLGEDSMDKGGGESLVNFLTGLRFLLQSRETIRKLPLTAALTSSGLLLMSRVGGYEAMLYGSAMISGAQQMSQAESFDCVGLYTFLNGMYQDLRNHGCRSGKGTLMETLSAALTRFRHGIERQENTVTLMHAVKAAAFSASECRATDVRVDSLAEISFSSCEEADELWATIAKRWIACICDAALQH